MKVIATKVLSNFIFRNWFMHLHRIKSCSFLWQLGSCFKAQPVRKGQFVSDLHFCFEETINSISKTSAVFVSLRSHNLYALCLTIWDKMNCDKIDFMSQWGNLTWGQGTGLEEWQSHLLHSRAEKASWPRPTTASSWNSQALADPHATFQENLDLSWFLNLKMTAHRQKHNLEKKFSQKYTDEI